MAYFAVLPVGLLLLAVVAAVVAGIVLWLSKK